MISVVIFSSCNNARYLAKNEFYYKGTDVTISDSSALPETMPNLAEDLEGLSSLESNKKVLGIYPLKLWLYNVGDTGIDMYVRNRSELDKKFLFINFEYLVNELNFLEPKSKFRRWLTTKAGEPPAILDTTAIENTQNRIGNYLYNRGFFYPSVDYHVDYHVSKKKATVHYEVTLRKLYKMNQVVYEIADTRLNKTIQSIPVQSFLKPGNAFDVDYFKFEKNRISEYLLNNGYYGFEKDYVYFEVDTGSGLDSLNVYVKISNPKSDSVHHRYRINNIYVYPDAPADFNGNPARLDTIRYSDSKSDYYIVSSHLLYKPGSIAEHIFINDSNKVTIGDSVYYNQHYYSASDFTQTVNAFSNLGLFKYTTIDPVVLDSGNYFRYLDIIIKLEPLPKKTFGYEINASATEDYLLGTSIKLSFAQKNMLRRLDQLRFNASAGIESQFLGGDVFIETTELNGSVDLILPKFFWPMNVTVPKRYYPKTITSLKFTYLDRKDFYTLFSSSFSWGATWIENSKAKQYTVNLININNVQVPETSLEFDSILDANLLLKQSFEPKFIFGPTGSWVYNSQLKFDKRNDIYFRINGEFAGNLFYLVNSAAENHNPFKKNADSVYFNLMGLSYSNFIKFDFDFRDYYEFNSANKFASRAYFGFVIPYWNSEVVPYVKQFFAGGTNDIRAFAIRRLGPGGYFPFIANEEDTTVSTLLGDQSGDIKLEFNLEYRFDIFSIFEGALFCDIGNIWTLKKDPYRNFANFQFNTFLNQIAIGPGAGLRLDFQYVILRLDAAYPLRDPAYDTRSSKEKIAFLASQGYAIPDKSVVWNIGINYPF